MVHRDFLLARIARAERLTAALDDPADRERLLALAAELRARLEAIEPDVVPSVEKLSSSG